MAAAAAGGARAEASGDREVQEALVIPDLVLEAPVAAPGAAMAPEVLEEVPVVPVAAMALEGLAAVPEVDAVPEAQAVDLALEAPVADVDRKGLEAPVVDAAPEDADKAD